MELKKLLQLIKSRLILIVSVSLVSGLLAGLGSRIYTPHYVASLNLHISKNPEVSTDTYNYDGFYAQQVAEGYADTVVGLLEGREMLVRALNRTGQDASVLNQYLQAIQVQKIAPQLINLQVSRPASDAALQLAQALAQTAQEEIRQLNLERNQEFVLKLVDDTPLVEYQELSPWIAAAAGFLAASMLMVSIVFLKEYLR